MEMLSRLLSFLPERRHHPDTAEEEHFPLPEEEVDSEVEEEGLQEEGEVLQEEVPLEEDRTRDRVPDLDHHHGVREALADLEVLLEKEDAVLLDLQVQGKTADQDPEVDKLPPNTNCNATS